FFHLSNHFLFPIGVFPVLALTSSMIFFEPDWPRQLWSWLRQPRLARPDWKWLVGGGLAIPIVGMALGWRSRPGPPPRPGPAPPPAVGPGGAAHPLWGSPAAPAAPPLLAEGRRQLDRAGPVLRLADDAALQEGRLSALPGPRPGNRGRGFSRPGAHQLGPLA